MDASKSLVALEGTAIEQIVKQAVNAAVIAQLGDPAQMVRAVVEKAMNEKVDSSGKVNSSSYYNDRPLIEAVAQINIQNVTREVVKEFFESHREHVKAAVVAELRKKKVVQTLASNMVERLASHASSLGLTVSLGINTNK